LEALHSPDDTLANGVVVLAHRLELELIRTQERLAFESIELEQVRDRFNSLRSERSQQRSAIADLTMQIAHINGKHATSHNALKLEIRSLLSAQTVLHAKLDQAEQKAREIQADGDRWKEKVEADLAEANARLEHALRRNEFLVAQNSSLKARLIGGGQRTQNAQIQTVRLREEVGRAEIQAAETDAENAALRNRLHQLEAKLTEAETQFAALSNLFLVQTEETIAQTRIERERLEVLAQVVRTSKFWRLKSLLRRLRHAVIFTRA